MTIIKLLLDVSTLSSVIFKSCKVTVTWQYNRTIVSSVLLSYHDSHEILLTLFSIYQISG